jgi:acyl dehydratase
MPHFHLVGTEIDAFEWEWTSKDTLLYAVGVGAGQEDPLTELEFTTENSEGVQQLALPSYAALMQRAGWIGNLGFEERQWEGMEWGRPRGLVAGEQGVIMHGVLPAEGKANVSVTLEGIYDKGSGALVVADAHVRLAGSDEEVATARMGLFIRGQGGFGGPRAPQDEVAWTEPTGEPDVTITYATIPGQSLIYRLSGDRNPHCSDPTRAQADGFEKPIFQGLGAFGFACRALLHGLCDGDVRRFGSMHVRFSKVIYPGETLETRIWRTDGGAQFRTRALENDKIVLDRGVFTLAA